MGTDIDLPRYKCHKEVCAFKIAKITRRGIAGGRYLQPTDERYVAVAVSHAYVKKHKPAVGGYYVRYDDGYQSFSLADVFEKAYGLIK